MKSIYYDKNWAILQQEKEGGLAETYHYLDGGSQVEYTYIIRKAGVIDKEQYYDILTPRGMGGPRCINCDTIDLVKYNESFTAYCKKRNIIAEYVRFDPWICNQDTFRTLYDELEHYGNLYCNNLNIDFYNEEYKRNVLRNIRKNINDIEVKFDFKGKCIDKFLELYQYTEEKHTVSKYYHLSKELLMKYFDLLKNKVAIASAFYHGKIISSSVVLFGEDIVHYHFLGNHPDYRNLYANTIIIYKTALLAKKMGKSLFDLGGGTINGNTAEYKRRFVGENGVFPYYVGKRILNSEIYKRLIELNGTNKPGYFPEYLRSL